MAPELASYYERGSQQLKRDRIYSRSFLTWAYETELGWSLTRLILSRRPVSALSGWLSKTRLSRLGIRRLARELNIDLSECLRPIGDFQSLNDFITREIDLSHRPVSSDPKVCVAPSDGRVLAYPALEEGERLLLKRNAFGIAELLRDEGLARSYRGGAVVVSRLYLDDYHHFHFPDSGVPGRAMSIRGRYFAVTPYSQRRRVPFFAENHRKVTLLDSDHFGRIAMVEVGAFTVGSIQERFESGERVTKGQHKGFFEVGGSVVVLLFPAGAIQLDLDLTENTLAGMETYVRFGDSIGRPP